MKGCGILIIGGNGQKVEGMLSAGHGDRQDLQRACQHLAHHFAQQGCIGVINGRTQHHQENSEFTILPEEFHNQIMEIAGDRF